MLLILHPLRPLVVPRMGGGGLASLPHCLDLLPPPPVPTASVPTGIARLPFGSRQGSGSSCL